MTQAMTIINRNWYTSRVKKKTVTAQAALERDKVSTKAHTSKVGIKNKNNSDKNNSGCENGVSQLIDQLYFRLQPSSTSNEAMSIVGIRTSRYHPGLGRGI